MNAREKAIQAHRALLNGGKLSYFEERGISAETVRAAWIGYDAASGAFTPRAVACSAFTTKAKGVKRTGSADNGGELTPKTCQPKVTVRSRTTSYQRASVGMLPTEGGV